MAEHLKVFAIGDIDELGIRGVVLRGDAPEAIREAGKHLCRPVTVVPADSHDKLVEALRQMVVNSEADGKSYRDCHKKAVAALASLDQESGQ